MKKLLLSSLVITSIFAFAYTSIDVENADYLANQGIILKQSFASKYRFTDTITRAEVVGIALKIKWVILPNDYQCKKYFSDVTTNDWICRAIEIWADEWFVSRANVQFRPQDKITIAEALAIMVKSGGITYPRNVVRNDEYFKSSIPQWIVDLVSWGLIGIGTFPDDPELVLKSATRGEVFYYAKNIIEYKLTRACNPSSTNFVCGNITQGIEAGPNYGPPEVCGCKPATCPEGQSVIISSDVGYWSDGSAKGIFTCSFEYPA